MHLVRVIVFVIAGFGLLHLSLGFILSGDVFDADKSTEEWNVMYYHDLTEFDDEIESFEKSLNKMCDFAASEREKKICSLYLEHLMLRLNHVKSKLNTTKELDQTVHEQKSIKIHSNGRNHYKKENTNQSTIINYEMPTAFQNISQLNGMLVELSECQAISNGQNCKMDLAEIDSMASSIVDIFEEKAQKIQRSLFYSQLGKPYPASMTPQQLIDDLYEIANSIENETNYAVDFDKWKRSLEHYDSKIGVVDIIDNKLWLFVNMPIKLVKPRSNNTALKRIRVELVERGRLVGFDSDDVFVMQSDGTKIVRGLLPTEYLEYDSDLDVTVIVTADGKIPLRDIPVEAYVEPTVKPVSLPSKPVRNQTNINI